jgi:hypothetical protein
MVRLPSLQREPSPFPPATSPYAHPRRNPYRSHHPHHPGTASSQSAAGQEGGDRIALALTIPNAADAHEIQRRFRRKRRWTHVRRVLAAASIAGAVLSVLRAYHRHRRTRQLSSQEYVLVDATTDRGGDDRATASAGGSDDDGAAAAAAAVSVTTAVRMLAERIQGSLWAVAVSLVRYSIQNARLIMGDPQ